METTLQPPKKIIIDTDPGIDDAMAIFVALRSPEVEVIGLTTIYGNVYTTRATRNALHLLEVAGRTDIPVAEGSHVTITKGTKLRIADFVHGADGLGNQNFPPPEGKPIEQSAAAFLVQKANLYPGKVTVVALGPLTNIALAIQLNPAFAKNIGQIVVLGGAFAVNGSVNPAAETNIFGDPDAADIVFTSGADVLAVGINVTRQVVLTDTDRDKLAQSGGKFAHYLCKILDVYLSYHHDSYCMKGVYLHDPTALLAAVNPSLITYTEGIVRVQTIGITRGLTLFYNKQKSADVGSRNTSEHTERESSSNNSSSRRTKGERGLSIERTKRDRGLSIEQPRRPTNIPDDPRTPKRESRESLESRLQTRHRGLSRL